MQIIVVFLSHYFLWSLELFDFYGVVSVEAAGFMYIVGISEMFVWFGFSFWNGGLLIQEIPQNKDAANV